MASIPMVQSHFKHACGMPDSAWGLTTSCHLLSPPPTGGSYRPVSSAAPPLPTHTHTQTMTTACCLTTSCHLHNVLSPWQPPPPTPPTHAPPTAAPLTSCHLVHPQPLPITTTASRWQVRGQGGWWLPSVTPQVHARQHVGPHNRLLAAGPTDATTHERGGWSCRGL
jgi:hypothetical protein